MKEKLWNLETRMDPMSKDLAESSCAKHTKLDALLRNSIAQSKSMKDKQPGTRVDFVEPQRKERESTSLPRIENIIGSRVTRSAMKGKPQTRRGHPGIQVHSRV